MFLITPLLLLCACNRTEHVKLTATVVADGVAYRGSVVQRFSCHGGGFVFGNSADCRVSGEAGAIDMGPRGLAFLTLDYQDEGPRGLPRAVAFEGASKPKAWPVSLDEAPYLVRFKNINDPRTVERIDPAHPEATPGVQFKALDEALTAEPITDDKIEKTLPWVSKIKRDKWGDLNGPPGINTYPDRFAGHLFWGSFKLNH